MQQQPSVLNLACFGVWYFLKLSGMIKIDHFTHDFERAMLGSNQAINGAISCRHHKREVCKSGNKFVYKRATDTTGTAA